MDIKLFFAVSFAILAAAQSAVPVFLSNSKLCTLHNVGNIPKGSVNYPVYQKVCRKVIGRALGDEVVDDEDDRETRKSNNKSKNEKEVEQLRRAILRSVWIKPDCRFPPRFISIEQ